MQKIEKLIETLLEKLNHFLFGSIHDWGTKKECLTEKGLHRTTFDFFFSYIIIIVIDYCMPIDKMISS